MDVKHKACRLDLAVGASLSSLLGYQEATRSLGMICCGALLVPVAMATGHGLLLLLQDPSHSWWTPTCRPLAT